ncbi:Hypothetical predicted protein [Lecanosticta acicola]|uniref:Uncharacterized protein n=1 Tax=Lecanosticta acicola TaxID=111012 RepID=A0AAI8Z728_9PEZI|nr:Hypothetical predicted protein [Lecanosticta acicola]
MPPPQPSPLQSTDSSKSGDNTDPPIRNAFSRNHKLSLDYQAVLSKHDQCDTPLRWVQLAHKKSSEKQVVLKNREQYIIGKLGCTIDQKIKLVQDQIQQLSSPSRNDDALAAITQVRTRLNSLLGNAEESIKGLTLEPYEKEKAEMQAEIQELRTDVKLNSEDASHNKALVEAQEHAAKIQLLLDESHRSLKHERDARQSADREVEKLEAQLRSREDHTKMTGLQRQLQTVEDSQQEANRKIEGLRAQLHQIEHLERPLHSQRDQQLGSQSTVINNKDDMQDVAPLDESVSVFDIDDHILVQLPFASKAFDGWDADGQARLIEGASLPQKIISLVASQSREWEEIWPQGWSNYGHLTHISDIVAEYVAKPSLKQCLTLKIKKMGNTR